MNRETLHAFLALCDELHFGRASRMSHLSRSALTRLIQRLEEEVGQVLFLRDNRSVVLTAAGRTFRAYARQAALDWDSVKAELQEEGVLGGVVSIYASVTAVYSLLPVLLERYRLQYPGVQLALRTGAAEEAVPQVMTGEIDLAVAAMPDRTPGKLKFLSLKKTALVFIGPRGLEGVPMVGGELDLAEATLVLPGAGLSRRRLDTYLKKRGIRPQVTTEVSGNEAMIAMVRLGCGVGLVPELVLDKSPFREEVEVIIGAPKLTPYEVGLCATKTSLERKSVSAFWKLAGA